MKTLLLLLFLALALPTLHGWHEPWCCFEPCCGGPLPCGSFSIALRGGGNWSSFTNKGAYLLANPALTPPIEVVTPLPSFHDQFNTPWVVGAEFAWNASRRLQFFLEYLFSQGNRRHKGHEIPILLLNDRNSNYRTQSGYLGWRFYFEAARCCFSRISPYIGLKAGLLFQHRVKESAFSSEPYYLSQTAVSGGLQMGLEWWFCRNISALLQAEFVAAQGPRANPNIALNPPIGGVTSIAIDRAGWIVSWPVTLGLRYAF